MKKLKRKAIKFPLLPFASYCRLHHNPSADFFRKFGKNFKNLTKNVKKSKRRQPTESRNRSSFKLKFISILLQTTKNQQGRRKDS